jgi:hypothetical protein
MDAFFNSLFNKHERLGRETFSMASLGLDRTWELVTPIIIETRTFLYSLLSLSSISPPPIFYWLHEVHHME